MIIVSIIVCASGEAHAQQSEYYQAAAKRYREAAANTKCPDRRTALLKGADWCDCVVGNLAGQVKPCGEPPAIPPCDGDIIGGSSGDDTNASDSGEAQSTQQNAALSTEISGTLSTEEDLESSIETVIDGITELASMELDDNDKTDSWFLLSGGVNLDGSGGPIAGTSADIGKTAGYFFSADVLSRKGISFMSSYTSLKSNYFHSFRAKGNDGNYRSYIGRTDIEMSSVGISLGKDFTGTTGTLHFVPSVGPDLIFEISNYFNSTNFSGVEYSEEFDKDLFFCLHGGAQLFYLFSKRLGVQAGGKYYFSPSESGSVFKTGNFFHMNAGVSIRLN